MWGLFWRLYAAHLFADFPLQTPAILSQKNRFKGIFIHAVLVLVTSAIVIVQGAVFRPVLFAMLLILFVLHFAIDWIKSLTGQVSARTGLLLFFADQIAHLGVILLLAAVFGWQYFYGPVSPFIRLSLAIFAIWVAPVIIYITRRAIKNNEEVGIYVERFSKFAKVERALLFIGLSFRSLPIVIICVIAAVLIRALLLLNEENVPVPVWEWIFVILSALAGRLVEYGTII